MAPGETNTWTIEVDGTDGSISYTTKLQKTLRTMAYEPGGPQAWHVVDLGSVKHYDRFEARVGLGNCYLFTQKLDEALAEYKRAYEVEYAKAFGEEFSRRWAAARSSPE